MYRFPSNAERYITESKLKGEVCPFCNLDDDKINPSKRKRLKETEHAVVTENLYPYDIWEGLQVEDHFMILPKRHVTELDQLSPEERQEIMDLCCEYGSGHYDVYNRAPASKVRSQAHIHFHLIKTKGSFAKSITIKSDPYDLDVVW